MSNDMTIRLHDPEAEPPQAPRSLDVRIEVEEPEQAANRGRGTSVRLNALARENRGHDLEAEAQGREGFPAASFTLELASISSVGVSGAQARRNRNGLIAPGESERQRALGALACALDHGHVIRFVHALASDAQGRRRYSMRVEGFAPESAACGANEQGRALRQNLVMALAAGLPEFGFRPATSAQPARKAAWPHHLRLAARGLTLQSRLRPGLVASQSRPPTGQVRLPLPPSEPQSFCDSLVAALPSLDADCEVRIELVGRGVQSVDLQAVARVAAGLLDAAPDEVGVDGCGPLPGSSGVQQVAAVQRTMLDWLSRPLGAQLRVSFVSQAPIPATLVQMVGHEILQGRPFDVTTGAAPPQPEASGDLADYLPYGSGMPALMPDPLALDELGYPRHHPAVHFNRPCEGILLGDAPSPFGEEEVRLGAADRSQHCYIVGSTGTGKSTLIQRMIEQDIEAGRGVALLDPHGDLYARALESIPLNRRDDVVLMDFTRFNAVPGINPLQLQTQHREIERGFIIQDLGQIFRKLYSDVPESLGPMFVQYMRNAVALAMEDPDGCATLLDVPRLFADETYREYLLSHCADGAMRDFWVGIAARVSGDGDLKNIAPYITNKFAEFTDNALVRLVVGQASSTVDFRAVMDKRQILLVNLSKGLLSEKDSRFLGMLITGRMFSAALGRANVAPALREPFHVYIDEFQNFTLSSTESMLAEARKFGLTLTLAHQNMVQLSPQMAQAVLANAGSVIFMRLGPHDADTLAQHVAPHFCAQDLMSLPDHHAVARLKISNLPSPPFVLRTRPSTPAMDRVDPADVVRRSGEHHCVAATQVRRQIELRRHAHLVRLTPAAAGLSEPLRRALGEQGMHSLDTLLAWPADGRAGLLKLATTLRDRQVLQRIDILASLSFTAPLLADLLAEPVR